jgi:DNA-binding transcriptional LysR family regulator
VSAAAAASHTPRDPADRRTAVLQRATAIKAELAALEATLDAFAKGEVGVVRIVAFPMAATALIAPALARLRETHPELETSVREASRDASLEMIRDGDADLAVVFEVAGDEHADTGGLVRQTLLDEEFFVALPRSHRLASHPRVALHGLRDENWIVGTAATPGPIERVCLSAGFAPHIVAAVDDQPTIQALVAGGVGVTLIPQLAVPSVRRDIVLRPARGEPLRRRISAVSLDVTPRVPALVVAAGEISRVASAIVARAGQG